jgi:nitrogen fixation protein FixH
MTTANEQDNQFVFTGWHMLAILVAFFGVVISVNVLMAYYANSSWSGILSKNTYVASQDFNIKAAEARAWEAQGFKGDFKVDGGRLEYRLQGPAGEIARLASVTAIFHRPVGDKQDFAMQLAKAGEGLFEAEHQLKPGQWIVDLAAVDNGKTIFHQAERIVIAEK